MVDSSVDADEKFADGSYFAWAEQAFADGLLPVCGMDIDTGKPLYCPHDLINRAWTAYLIVKSNDLLLP
ncbi:MAG: hypothetical protein MIO92_07125 [Methanosarcinaceae archaeon]|nr:hypothetical protein [Methanosarcinaceae archaeon]